MYGPGPGVPPPPPRPADGGVIALRVLFTALPVLSFGLLAWVSMLRLALVLKRTVDWTLLGADVALMVIGFAFTAAADDDTSSWQSNVGAALLVLCMGATAVYFLVTDIRLAQAPATPWTRPAGYAQPGPFAAGFAGRPVSIPGAQQGGAPGVVPGPAAVTGHGAGPVPAGGPAGHPGAAGAAVPPPRISQVRAELDELSDYLRQQEGR